MENRGLLFIPDISGFTRFVHESEIEHSRFIIQELLELLIDANQIGLEVSEIEGDAILFYRYGEPPELEQLYHQVEKMFRSFHRHLQTYENRRLCQCKACVSAINLSLKVITHYGEFTGYSIKNFNKLIGKDVIVAHQLLKNDIDKHEYWLVTQNLLKDKEPGHFTAWMNWIEQAKETEAGLVPFHFTPLSQLKAEIEPEPLQLVDLKEKPKIFSITKVFPVDLKKLFYAALHFKFRHRWQEGVRSIEEISHLLPGVGSSHRCITDKGDVIMLTSHFSYDPESRIEYSESDEQHKKTILYTLDKLDANTSRLTIDWFQKKNIVSHLLYPVLGKSRQTQYYRRSFEKLEALLQEIEIPVEF